MTRVFIADGQVQVRSILRLLLLDLTMQIVGEAADWSATLANMPPAKADMVLVD